MHIVVAYRRSSPFTSGAGVWIDFLSLSEAIDTSTPAGKMTSTVIGAVADLERSLIVERVKAGLRNARAKVTVMSGKQYLCRWIEENFDRAMKQAAASYA
jgi:DNA invertase Pin-like site-specific DNA recombinase